MVIQRVVVIVYDIWNEMVWKEIPSSEEQIPVWGKLQTLLEEEMGKKRSRTGIRL